MMDKNKLQETIKNKVAEIWHKDTYPQDPDNITVEIKDYRGETGVWITISSMYNAPGLTFANLTALSQYFKTERIDTLDEFSYGGCETCDYGSSYGFILVVLPPKK